MTATLSRIGDTLRALSGWRAWFAAIVAGAVFALGFAPFDLFPAMLLALAALVLLLDGAAARPKPVRRAAALGWGFGFGQFLVGMHWIFYPFLVDPVEHGWQIPFVAILFPGGLALFAAAACALALWLWKPGPSRILALTVCYAAAEWLRGHILTGLPWNLPAYGWEASLGVMQSMALFGAYGLSLLTILFGAALAELFAPRPRFVFVAAMAALFIALWLGGELRLADAPTTTFADVRLRLVQPNIPQDQKYVRELAARNWQTLMSLSTRETPFKPTIIVWPEAAPPVLLQHAPDALDAITIMTGGTGRTLITGNQRIAIDADGHRHFYNSLYAFGRGGQLLVTYDKFHLVPFGEYLPVEGLLKSLGITELVGFPGSFTAGDGPHTVKIPGAPDVGPLICYEILFPGAVIGESRPGWIVNVTDDSWFGPWAGPRQHLLAARARAIEEGLPIARAANTGISAVIDPVGRVVAALDLGHAGVVDSRLPQALSPTPYARFGDLGFCILLWLCAGLSWVLARRVQAS